MNVKTFIESGRIENYCLGFCSDEEVMEIELFSAQYPAVKMEIERVQRYFEEQVLTLAVKPPTSVKTGVMRSIYKQETANNSGYAPFIEETSSIHELQVWARMNGLKLPDEDFDNLSITAMPSTAFVTNLVVAAKKGHEPEIHTDFVEYLFILKGSCTMNFDGVEKAYNKHGIIKILPDVVHFAVITSPEPMLALVQRQKIF